ncbi:hypothetical protein LSTR_LSTR006027 [Laodelphax striatellus]|uniref:Thioredoxin domain-containing protein n=1 Tax=Laodelphax striatellus TaxID=195883 RepID=A0A482XP97_LAOST|nr:hypothetical protein LSTR_LSTR006027 [Laodelphax striatellus]
MLAACRRLASTRSLHLAGAVQKSFTIHDNDEFVQNVMNSSVPVIVNFHAEWCDPCHILTPKLKELIETRTDINLATVDVEKCAELVHTFEVKAVPAVIAIRNGLVIDKFIGLVDGDMIDSLINKLCPPKVQNESQSQT